MTRAVDESSEDAAPERITRKQIIFIFGSVFFLWLLTPVAMLWIGDLAARGQAGDLLAASMPCFPVLRLRV
jgi:hypothetical protein